jgi:hypothetical protein
VKDPASRDEQTVAIATALTLAAATFAVAVVIIVIFGDLSRDFDGAFPWVTGIAAAAGFGYLIIRRV